MEDNKNIAFKIAIVICILLFGVFIVFYLLRNRKSGLVLDTNTDSQNISNDWQNIYGDLQTAFDKLTK